MECSRKGEMRPIIKEKFLFGLHVYMKMPKLPAVTIASLAKAPFPTVLQHTYSRGRYFQKTWLEEEKSSHKCHAAFVRFIGNLGNKHFSTLNILVRVSQTVSMAVTTQINANHSLLITFPQLTTAECFP